MPFPRGPWRLRHRFGRGRPGPRTQTTPPLLTYSWDRLLIDPLPGPRTLADFDYLSETSPGVFEVVPTSTTRPPAASALPRLSAELPAHLLLLDPSGGVAGMARQIAAAADHCVVDQIGLVDVGGDVLTNGSEPTLRSPLADLLALASCAVTGIPCHLFVLGPGVDGELDEGTVLRRLTDLDAAEFGTLGAEHAAPIRDVFAWHPSEGSGMLAAAAEGARGVVETRDAANRVELTDITPRVFAVDALEAVALSPAHSLRDTTSLTEVRQLVVEHTGVDEIGYETDKATRMSSADGRPRRAVDIATVDDHAAEAARRGCDFVTFRRLAELAGATSGDGLLALQDLLSRERADRYAPPLYRVGPDVGDPP